VEAVVASWVEVGEENSFKLLEDSPQDGEEIARLFAKVPKRVLHGLNLATVSILAFIADLEVTSTGSLPEEIQADTLDALISAEVLFCEDSSEEGELSDLFSEEDLTTFSAEGWEDILFRSFCHAKIGESWPTERGQLSEGCPKTAAALRLAYPFISKPSSKASLAKLDVAKLRVLCLCCEKAVKTKSGKASRKSEVLKRVSGALWPSGAESNFRAPNAMRSGGQNWRAFDPEGSGAVSSERAAPRGRGGGGQGRPWGTEKAGHSRKKVHFGDMSDYGSSGSEEKEAAALPGWAAAHARAVARAEGLGGVNKEPRDDRLDRGAGYDGRFEREPHREPARPQTRGRPPSRVADLPSFSPSPNYAQRSRGAAAFERRTRYPNTRAHARAEERLHRQMGFEESDGYCTDEEPSNYPEHDHASGNGARPRWDHFGAESSELARYQASERIQHVAGPASWSASLLAMILFWMGYVNNIVAQDGRRSRGTGSMFHRMHRQSGNTEYLTPSFIARLARGSNASTLQSFVRNHPVFLSSLDALQRTKRELLVIAVRLDHLMRVGLPRLCCCGGGRRHGRRSEPTVPYDHPFVQALANCIEVDLRRFMAITTQGESLVAGTGGRWDVAEGLESETTRLGGTLVPEESLREAQRAVKLRRELAETNGKKK
jgi:hypothetical protein